MSQRERVTRAKSARSTAPTRLLADGQTQMAPWRTLITAVHPHPSVKINHGATFLVTDQQGAIPHGSGGEYGLHDSDTRFVSRHELRFNGKRPDSVASVRLSFRHARWHMVADSIAGPGGDMREARVALTLDRLISLHQMHEDITLHTYARTPVTVLLEVALESDFADLFEVRYRSWQRRADLNTWWVGPASLESRYQNDDFVRRCLVRALTTAGGMTYANGALRIPADLAPGQEWKICLQYDLLTSDEQIPEMAASCVFEAGGGDPLRHTRSWQQSVSQIEPTDIRLQFAYERAIEDFAALRLHEQDTSRRARAGRTSNEDRWMPAAGLPWFMALFGRDSLIASIQAMVAQPAVAMARSKTWRAGSRMLTTPTATPNQARSRTSFWWGSGRTSESCRTGPITGPRTPHLYICCCWPRTFGGRAMRMRSAISAARRSARWNGSTATAIATATGSRSTRRAHRPAIATRAGVMRTMACSTTAAPFPSCRSPRRRCRPTYTARRLESHRSSSLGRPRA